MLCDSDAVETYRSLIEPRRAGAATRIESLHALSRHAAVFVVPAGTRRRYENLAHHNIFSLMTTRRSFARCSRTYDPPLTRPFTSAPHRGTDSSQAPCRHENLSSSNAPATARHTLGKESAAYRDLIVRKLEDFGVEDLSVAIDYEHIITPRIFRRGTTLIAEPSTASRPQWTSAFLRPPNKARGIESLYFAGRRNAPRRRIRSSFVRKMAQNSLKDEGQRMSN